MTSGQVEHNAIPHCHPSLVTHSNFVTCGSITYKEADSLSKAKIRVCMQAKGEYREVRRDLASAYDKTQNSETQITEHEALQRGFSRHRWAAGELVVEAREEGWRRGRETGEEQQTAATHTREDRGLALR
ncbi:unnamed protein product [Rangifer tarandus platyrhynchus]|uniref:Uncharacterized protein n=1 Tax=Rangifer tarandus platyrhynchus TaxID=3082113 RepID=A0ABN8ZTL5_RANTA|nr:unnamed protein product [Rangifer tarandus platyrhynchus]